MKKKFLNLTDNQFNKNMKKKSDFRSQENVSYY